MATNRHKRFQGMGVCAGLFLLCAALSTARADEAMQPTRSAEASCAGQKTEQAMLICYRRYLSESENELKYRFDKLMKSYTENEPKMVPFLVAAQKAWEEHRRADCKLETFYSMDGSGYEVYWLGCLSKKNNSRAAYYADLLRTP